jgi:hypothetical protein
VEAIGDKYWIAGGQENVSSIDLFEETAAETNMTNPSIFKQVWRKRF